MDGSLAVLDKAVEECLSVSLWARSPEELVEFLDRLQVLANAEDSEAWAAQTETPQTRSTPPPANW